VKEEVMTDMIVFEIKARCSICRATLADTEDLTTLIHLAADHPDEFDKLAPKITDEKLVRIARKYKPDADNRRRVS
jgi:hypothetical protein